MLTHVASNFKKSAIVQKFWIVKKYFKAGPRNAGFTTVEKCAKKSP
jgi:hypothetical protein